MAKDAPPGSAPAAIPTAPNAAVASALAQARGISVSHAEALLAAGWEPDDGATPAGRATTLLLQPPLADPDADDESLLDAVVAHYQRALAGSPSARALVATLGVDQALADKLRLGYANRSIGYRLPEANRKAGAALRSRLTAMGIYRASGHEHLNGCVVVPVVSPVGGVVGMCGYRLGSPNPEVLWAHGLPGGIFGEPEQAEDLLFVASVRDALAVLGTGHTAVVAPGRPGGFQRGDIARLLKAGLRRAVVVTDRAGDRTLEHLRRAGVECLVVRPGASLADALSPAPDRRGALDALLASAVPFATPPTVPALGGNVPVLTRAPAPAAPLPGGSVSATASSGHEAAPPTGPVVTVNGDPPEVHVAFPGHRFRVRAAGRRRVPGELRVALSVTDEATGAFHLDTLDLYQAKARGAYLEVASTELKVDRDLLARELAEVIFATEAALVDGGEAPRPGMSQEEHRAALELLSDPRLLERIVDDLATLGVVGERTNLAVAYLATISRRCERPLGVVIQSSSAAGKSTLADAVVSLVPEEDLVSFSALTGQSLYYLGEQALSHKVLAISEEEGAKRAAYALKLLMSQGGLCIASTAKDAATGRLRTASYTVSGPIALVLTTTNAEIDEELANRLITLGADESPAQTAAIHAAQRRTMSLDGLKDRLRRDELIATHRNAQRLLEAIPVVIPDEQVIDFPAHALRHRRDHAKALGLICTVTLLHQHQRTRATVSVAGKDLTYLEADPADIELGIALARATLGQTDGLSPQIRRVLDAAREIAAEKASDEDLSPSFTRRELRERLGCSEHQVRAGLARLVSLEYVCVKAGPCGCQHRYRLAEDLIEPSGPGGPPRTPRDDPQQGETGLRPAQTPDPAARTPQDRVDDAVALIVPVGALPPEGGLW